jgi:histone acetyltransferase (RNA polymerase elongator complex component)
MGEREDAVELIGKAFQRCHRAVKFIRAQRLHAPANLFGEGIRAGFKLGKVAFNACVTQAIIKNG